MAKAKIKLNPVKKRVNGNAKGKAGEREFAALLRSYGFEARRSQQYCGVAGDEDVICDMPGVHFEVKRREALNVRAAVEQAMRDAAPKGDMPIVAHRCNRSEWLVTLRAEDFLKMVRAVGDF